MRTTDEWAALLNDTTPGPWTRSTDGWENFDVRTADQKRWIANIAEDEHMNDEQRGRAEADTDLIAVAPEAVAEVVRLRRALARVENELHHVTQYALAQGRKLRAKQLQAQRLQEALRNADRFGPDALANLIEREYITEEDMQ